MPSLYGLTLTLHLAQFCVGLAMIGSFDHCGPTYTDDVVTICSSHQVTLQDDAPDVLTREAKITRYIDTHISTDEGRALFERWASPGVDFHRPDLLRNAASQRGVLGCDLADWMETADEAVAFQSDLRAICYEAKTIDDLPGLKLRTERGRRLQEDLSRSKSKSERDREMRAAASVAGSLPCRRTWNDG